MNDRGHDRALRHEDLNQQPEGERLYTRSQHEQHYAALNLQLHPADASELSISDEERGFLDLQVIPRSVIVLGCILILTFVAGSRPTSDNLPSTHEFPPGLRSYKISTPPADLPSHTLQNEFAKGAQG